MQGEEIDNINPVRVYDYFQSHLSRGVHTILACARLLPTTSGVKRPHLTTEPRVYKVEALDIHYRRGCVAREGVWGQP